MSFTAQDLMTAAGYVLNDAGTRWTYPELCFWINEGIRSIIFARPQAASQVVTLPLAVGTLQSVPAQYMTILKITSNITAVGPPIVRGRAIRITTRDALDAVCPEWNNPAKFPYAQQVRQYVFDDDDPRTFYVYPGNDGTGNVEGIVSTVPAMVTIANGADPNALASYDVDVDVKDIYQPVLLDYVLYRAFSKDDIAGAAPPVGAQYFQAFAQAMGIKVQVAQATSPNAPPRPA